MFTFFSSVQVLPSTGHSSVCMACLPFCDPSRKKLTKIRDQRVGSCSRIRTLSSTSESPSVVAEAVNKTLFLFIILNRIWFALGAVVAAAVAIAIDLLYFCGVAIVAAGAVAVVGHFAVHSAVLTLIVWNIPDFVSVVRYIKIVNVISSSILLLR